MFCLLRGMAAAKEKSALFLVERHELALDIAEDRFPRGKGKLYHSKLLLCFFLPWPEPVHYSAELWGG